MQAEPKSILPWKMIFDREMLWQMSLHKYEKSKHFMAFRE